MQYIIAIKQGRDHILIRFKCNLFSVSECVVCASGHPSSILDHESPMIIKGEYKVHLLNDKIRRNACLSCLLLICENLFYIFPYTCLLSLWVAVNSVTISSSHDRDSRSPIFFPNFVSIAVKAVIVGHLFSTHDVLMNLNLSVKLISVNK